MITEIDEIYSIDGKESIKTLNMKILIVDDSYSKTNIIKHSIEEAVISIQSDITCVSYGCDAMSELMEGNYDLLVTDMQYRWMEDGKLDDQCGIKLLEEMSLYDINVKTIVCSSVREDVRDFGNVIDYILFQGREMSSEFERALKALQ